MRPHGLTIMSVMLIACGSTSHQPPAQTSPELPAVASQPPPAPAPVAFKDLGAQVLEWMRTGKTRELRGVFDRAMTRAMPSDAIVAQLWPDIENKLGPFKRLIELSESETDGYHVVTATCEFEHASMDVRLVFDEERHLAGLKFTPTTSAFAPRPQLPKPPFDYDSHEVSYDNATDHTHLAGTLTVPRGAGPFPAVLLVTGSGTQDRDETIFGHKPFFVIADHLTRHGIAVLRVDDPGAGGSTGDLDNATVESHARDAEAGIAFLKAQKELDSRRLGVIGHSEGGLIAAIVASRSKSVAFVVSLAGTGLPGSTITVMQVESGLRSQKDLPEVAINEIIAAQKKVLSLVMGGADDRVLQAALDDGLAVTRTYTPGATGAGSVGMLKLLTSPWFKSFLKLDPREYWRNVKVPVLAMNGDRDTQVPADANLAEITAALRKAKNKDAQIEKLAGLNHLFQPANTGLVDEYATISTTFDPGALDLMTSWLTRRTSAK